MWARSQDPSSTLAMPRSPTYHKTITTTTTIIILATTHAHLDNVVPTQEYILCLHREKWDAKDKEYQLYHTFKSL